MLNITDRTASSMAMPHRQFHPYQALIKVMICLHTLRESYPNHCSKGGGGGGGSVSDTLCQGEQEQWYALETSVSIDNFHLLWRKAQWPDQTPAWLCVLFARRGPCSPAILLTAQL